MSGSAARRSTGSTCALTCPTNPWRRCTLDGYIVETGRIWEAKHTNAFAKSEEVLERYMPQLQHNMAVARVERAVLSVIFGNHKYEMFEVASDWVYQIELLQAEADFWDCVQTGREPVPAPAPHRPSRSAFARSASRATIAGRPPRPTGWRIARRQNSMRRRAASSRSWSSPMSRRAFGHGIEAKRSKAGAITIRELSHELAAVCAARLPGDQRHYRGVRQGRHRQGPHQLSSTSTSIARSTMC